MKSRKILLGLIVGICVCFAGSLSAQKANYQSNKLVEIGPDNIGGRVTSIVAFAAHEYGVGEDFLNYTFEMYAGAATGGLYYNNEYNFQSWTYIPCYINGEEVTLPISSMVKFNDSTLVIATGESAYAKGNKVKKMTAIGKGLFLFNTNTRTFTQVSVTNPGTDLEADFASVNDMACMTLQGITYFYVATPKGLFRWNIAQNSDWNNAPVRVFDGSVRCIKVSKQFNRAFFTSKGNVYKIGDVINGYEPVDITGSCSAFGNNAGAIELALAPSDESYLYAMVIKKNGMLEGVYQSHNTNSWLLLTSSTVAPFDGSANGATCGTITVSPIDPQTIILGGSTIWVGKGYVENAPFQWTVTSMNENQLNYGDYMSTVYSNYSFCHSGIHQIVPTTCWIEETQFMRENYYVATDGGIYYSANPSMIAFENYNRGLNNVQINSVAVCPDGSIISGANSNACPFIESRMEHNATASTATSTWYDPQGSSTNHMANIIWKGNGGAVAASRFTQYSPISRRPLFVSSENGAIGRAYADYSNYTNTQTWTSDVMFTTDLIAGGPAIGQIYLWETDHNTASNDSITFILDTLGKVYRNGEEKLLSSNFTVEAGDSIVVLDPAHASYPFGHIFDHSFVVKDEMRQTVPQPYLSRILAVTVENDMPKNTNVSYCWFPTDFRKVFDESNDTRFWSHIYAVNGATNPNVYVRYAVMSQDGDCAIIVVENDTLEKSFLVRVHGFNSVNYNDEVHQIRDKVNYKISTRVTTTDTLMVAEGNYFFDRRISSISVDPREGKDAVIITFDGFNNDAANVVYIDNVTSDNYTIKYIPLPTATPAYSAIVEYTTGALYVGTEEGVFTASSVNNPSWQPYGAFNGVPVTAIYQVTNNYPVIKHLDHDGVTEVPYVFPHTKWPYAMYFGTYGRGIFMDSTYVVDHTNEIVTPDEFLDIPTVASTGDNTVRFYPNPAVDNATMEINVVKAGNATVRIYDLTGKLVYTENLGRLSEGVQTRTIDCQNFQHGMYLVNVAINGQKATSKLIVR